MTVDFLISNCINSLNIDGYLVVNHVGSGAIGHMFRCRNEQLSEDRAIKFIPILSLGDGWENEIIKVNKLKKIDKVVRYYKHDIIDICGQQFLYIMWDYVENNSLKSIIESKQLTVPILIDVLKTVLEVFHACQAIDVIHADLHSGNILIEKENEIYLDSSYRKIWVTDFGRLTPDSDKEFLDDYWGLNRILQEGLRSINFNMLDAENKRIHRMLRNEFSKCLCETDITVDECSRNPKKLLERLEFLLRKSQESGSATSSGVSDYLAAEHLGDNFAEWKAIFVPKFIAIDELLARNICVLTGLRGCGKTMLFRRLSSYFNLKIGEVPKLNGADSFYAFYLNARDIAEAFPWLPDDSEFEAHAQVVNSFNLNWTLEILIWLRELYRATPYDMSFLNAFFKKYFPLYFTAGDKQNINHLISIVRDEIDKSRLRSNYKNSSWPVGNYDFLGTLVDEIKVNVPGIEPKPFYFFLDDYSLPMLKSTMQRILNPVIFRRSANVIFKVSTESVESFFPESLNRKVLEENDDYSLIDCGTLTLGQNAKNKCKDILFSILQPRIDRHPLFKERKLNLEKILGKTKLNNENRAKILRKDILDGEIDGLNKKHLYQGWDVFCDMWSSDVREMINLFAEMILREDESNLRKKDDCIISDSVQNEVYVESGGQFMALLKAATNPSERIIVDKEHKYARHLSDIVEAFHEVASFDLKNKNSKNQDRNTIKKARRIEITNVEAELPPEAHDYYRGLIRYGIFIRDYRGKSVRGKIVPRLYLRSRLIPYFKLTFSKRDHISMNWDEFKMFLLEPREYVKAYKKDASHTGNVQQFSLFDLGGK